MRQISLSHPGHKTDSNTPLFDSDLGCYIVDFMHGRRKKRYLAHCEVFPSPPAPETQLREKIEKLLTMLSSSKERPASKEQVCNFSGVIVRFSTCSNQNVDILSACTSYSQSCTNPSLTLRDQNHISQASPSLAKAPNTREQISTLSNYEFSISIFVPLNDSEYTYDLNRLATIRIWIENIFHTNTSLPDTHDQHPSSFSRWLNTTHYSDRDKYQFASPPACYSFPLDIPQKASSYDFINTSTISWSELWTLPWSITSINSHFILTCTFKIVDSHESYKFLNRHRPVTNLLARTSIPFFSGRAKEILNTQKSLNDSLINDRHLVFVNLQAAGLGKTPLEAQAEAERLRSILRGKSLLPLPEEPSDARCCLPLSTDNFENGNWSLMPIDCASHLTPIIGQPIKKTSSGILLRSEFGQPIFFDFAAQPNNPLTIIHGHDIDSILDLCKSISLSALAADYSVHATNSIFPAIGDLSTYAYTSFFDGQCNLPPTSPNQNTFFMEKEDISLILELIITSCSIMGAVSDIDKDRFQVYFQDLCMRKILITGNCFTLSLSDILSAHVESIAPSIHVVLTKLLHLPLFPKSIEHSLATNLMPRQLYISKPQSISDECSQQTFHAVRNIASILFTILGIKKIAASNGGIYIADTIDSILDVEYGQETTIQLIRFFSCLIEYCANNGIATIFITNHPNMIYRTTLGRFLFSKSTTKIKMPGNIDQSDLQWASIQYGIPSEASYQLHNLTNPRHSSIPMIIAAAGITPAIYLFSPSSPH